MRSGQGLYMAHKYKTNLGKLEDGICVVELEHILMSSTLNYIDTDKLLQIKKKKKNQVTLPKTNFFLCCHLHNRNPTMFIITYM